MSNIKIKTAFEKAIDAISPKLPTQYQNVPFTIPNTAYQKLDLIPAYNNSMFINENGYKSVGIFQITLMYPLSQGTKDIFTRTDLYLEYFDRAVKLSKDGVEISISNTPDVRIIGIIGDRYVVAISIEYKSFLKML